MRLTLETGDGVDVVNHNITPEIAEWMLFYFNCDNYDEDTRLPIPEIDVANSDSRASDVIRDMFVALRKHADGELEPKS